MASRPSRDPGDATATGFTLARSYLDASGAPATAFHAGDFVTVKLTVTAATDHRWVALVDPLPAGFEAVNPALASGKPSDPPSPTRARWTPVTWDHQNLRDDRVEWFADHMAAGHYELTYQARATIDGHFTAAPATVEAMYQPDQHARTAREAITVAASRP